MNILVCVKRVPATGGKIVLTADAQDIDTRFLGFTISPHEECGVEEAVRIVEAQSGSSTVLTLGPEVATEQLRDAMAIGIDNAVLLQTDGADWDAYATAGAIADAIRELEAESGAFDLILFGNEAADTGDFQVGIRVATALGRPVVSGVKGIAAADGRVEARREAAGGGWEVFDLAMPAVLGVKEGLNLPRYPSVPGRLRARKKEIRTIAPARRPGGPTKSRLRLPEGTESQVEVIGQGAAAAPAVVELFRKLGVAGPMTVLVLVEHADARPDRLSLEALAVAASLGEPVDGLVIGRWSTELAGGLAGRGIGTVHVVDDPRLAEFAPAAWAASLVQLAAERSAAIVIAAGSDRGNEVMAHVGARLDLPMAANVTEILGGEPLRLVRQRWAGSLLEEATLDAPTKLLTIAPHAVAVEESAAGAAPAVATFAPQLSDADIAVAVARRLEPDRSGVSLADARVVVGGGRGVGSAEGFADLEELAGLLGAAVGVSRVVTSQGWRPHSMQIGQTGMRIAPDLYIACGISGAIQHIVGARAAKRILAINTDAEAPIMAVADYAVIGDLHQVVPAISAEVRRVTGR